MLLQNFALKMCDLIFIHIAHSKQEFYDAAKQHSAVIQSHQNDKQEGSSFKKNATASEGLEEVVNLKSLPVLHIT